MLIWLARKQRSAARRVAGRRQAKPPIRVVRLSRKALLAICRLPCSYCWDLPPELHLGSWCAASLFVAIMHAERLAHACLSGWTCAGSTRSWRRTPTGRATAYPVAPSATAGRASCGSWTSSPRWTPAGCLTARASGSLSHQTRACMQRCRLTKCGRHGIRKRAGGGVLGHGCCRRDHGHRLSSSCGEFSISGRCAAMHSADAMLMRMPHAVMCRCRVERQQHVLRKECVPWREMAL